MPQNKIVLSFEDLAVLLTAYNLRSFQQVVPFEAGGVQTNIRIDSTQGSFVLRYYEDHPVEWVTYETALIRFLVEKGFPTPTVIADKKGRSFGLYHGKPFVLFGYIKGDAVAGPESALHPEQRAGVARMVARLHGVTHRLVLPFESVRVGRSVAACGAVANGRGQGVTDIFAREERLGWIREALSSLSLSDKLPVGVCHGRCDPESFVFDGGEPVAMLHFQRACSAPFITDVAALIDGWAWKKGGVLDHEAVRSLLAAYTEGRALSALEKDSLYDALKLEVLFSLAQEIESLNAFERAKERFRGLETLGRESFSAMMFGA